MIYLYDIKIVFILRIIKVGVIVLFLVERKINLLFVEIEKNKL